VLAKLAVIALVILLGFPHVRPNNLTPFVVAPKPAGPVGDDQTVLQLLLGGSQHTFGWYGIFVSAAVVAFAYIGFDVLATAAEETARPRTDVARSMITSLLIVTGLYVGVAFVMVGMVPFRRLAESPRRCRTRSIRSAGFMRNVIDFGAVIGLAPSCWCC
jgi:APA family basic amino acid/polyamine antiporter